MGIILNKKTDFNLNSFFLLRRFGINTLAYGYAQVVTILVQFIQVPLFLHFWGVEKYGEWLVLAGFPLLLGMAEFGIAQASASKSSLESGRGDFQSAQNTLKTAQVYTLTVCFLILITVCLLVSFFDFAKVLNLSLTNRFASSISIIFLTLSICINLQGGVFDAWMRAYNQPAISGFISANLRVFETIFLATALFCNTSFIGASLACLFATILTRFLHFKIAFNKAPKHLKLNGNFCVYSLQKIIKPSLGYISFSLTQAFAIQGGIQLLFRFGSSTDVVLLNMARTLVRVIFQIGVVINNALRPEFSRMFGEALHREAFSFMLRIWKFSFLICIFVYFCIILGGPAFVYHWSHGTVLMNRYFLALIGLHAVLGSFWYVPASLSMAENRHSFFALNYVGSSIISFLLWISFHSLIDPLFGACLMLLIPELCMACCIWFVFRRSIFSI